jgi:hypothetical protein
VIYIPIHHQVLNWGIADGWDMVVDADDQVKFKYFGHQLTSFLNASGAGRVDRPALFPLNGCPSLICRHFHAHLTRKCTGPGHECVSLPQACGQRGAFRHWNERTFS